MTSINDPNEAAVSRVLGQLPLSQLLATPFVSAADAQTQLANATLNFIDSVVNDKENPGKARTARFESSTTDANGVVSKKELEVPLLALVNVPALYIQKVSVELVVEVDARTTSRNSATAQSGQSLGVHADAAYDCGCFSASLSADYNAYASLVSETSSSNSVNANATYTIQMEAVNEKPVGLQAVLDFLVAGTAPTTAAK